MKIVDNKGLAKDESTQRQIARKETEITKVGQLSLLKKCWFLGEKGIKILVQIVGHLMKFAWVHFRGKLFGGTLSKTQEIKANTTDTGMTHTFRGLGKETIQGCLNWGMEIDNYTKHARNIELTNLRLLLPSM